METRGIRWVQPPDASLGDARAAQSCRTGGNSEHPFASLNLGYSAGDDPERVGNNERLFSAALRLPGPVAKAKLEHGVGWTTVESPGTYASHDALLTRVAGLPLWLTVADCLPVAFSAGAWVGLAHCGWRGTAGGLAAIVAVEIGARAATGIADVRAWIGAGIGECCYEVGPDVAARFPAETIHAAGDSMRLNLSRAVQISLMEAGVPAASIHASELCTACRADLFFSYRRDGPRSGRMAAVVWKPAP